MSLHTNSVIQAETSNATPLCSTASSSIKKSLSEHGYCLLRGFDVDLQIFSQLVKTHCSSVTFDPARKTSGESVQKVDAGTDAIGLHVENGNTPLIPQLVAFYCETAALHGSQTTLCDGQKLLGSMDKPTKTLFDQPMFVHRTLQEPHWKSYLANEHPQLSHPDQVTPTHLEEMIQMIPGQKASLNADGTLEYTVTVKPLMESILTQRKSFANAVLGPSFNYQPPNYTFADGRRVSDDLKDTLAKAAESHTVEIDWLDGDIALIDNHRVMHGRRAITDAQRRKLYIGMGNF